MNEFKTDEAAELQEGPAASPRWTGAPSIELAHRLNAQCVEIACELAVSPHRTLPAFILQNRDLWRLLEPEARERVAAFQDLMLETLLFARQSAREDVVVARAMFALTSPAASLIAALSLQQVRAIALRHTEQLRVRWDEDPEFWRDLLIACRADNEEDLAAIRRQGKLLFCGELVPSPQSARPDDRQ